MEGDTTATPDPTEAVEDSATTETDATDNWERRFKDTQGAYTKSQQELAAEKAVWDDEEQLYQRLAEKFPHWLEDDEDDGQGEELTDADTDELDPHVAALEQLAEIRYERDLNRLLADRELTEKGRSVVNALCKEHGNNPNALKQAVETWFALADDFKPADEKPKPKPAHVMRGGQAATDQKDWSQMSRDEINRAMTDRARALETQT